MSRTERVLVVEGDPQNRERYGQWLEDNGFEVAICPGPKAPDYSCVGSRNGRCPLVASADVVVLGLDLDSEIEQQGTSAFELLDLYTSADRPVVALGSDPGLFRMFPERVVTRIPGPATRGELAREVRAAVARAAGCRAAPSSIRR